MVTLLLIIIYLAFISLGLPDSLLGSSWPMMQGDLGMPLSGAGFISMMISAGTIISSLISDKVMKRFGTGKVTVVSVFLTAISLYGYSISHSFLWFCVFAIPLGLGAGAVDSGLNNFVALHYKANHMSWLHCFWGIGATSGPMIIASHLTVSNGWRKGYFIIAMIQFALVFLLFFTLPLWKRLEKKEDFEEEQKIASATKKEILSIPGVKLSLLVFFCYSSIELTTGLWGSSFLVNAKGIAPNQAAQWISLFYLGITLGRLLAGFILIKIKNEGLIRFGEIIILIGTILLMLPLPVLFCMVGLIFIGFGCAPIFPGLLHDTPKRVGQENSQAMMGFQMACAYVGSMIIPPLFGILASQIDVSILSIYLFIFAVVMLVCHERLNKIQNSNVNE